MLITVAEVLASMNLPSSLEATVTTVVTSAIIKAQVRLEGEIGYGLNIHEVEDLFNPNSDLMGGIPGRGGLFRLRLSKAYLLASFTPVVAVADTWNGEYAVLDATAYKLSKSEGIVLMDPESIDKRWVRAVYRAGFSKTVPADPQIKQALIALTVQGIGVTALTGSVADEKSASKKQSQDDWLGLFTQKLKRQGSLQHIPIISNQTDV